MLHLGGAELAQIDDRLTGEMSGGDPELILTEEAKGAAPVAAAKESLVITFRSDVPGAV